MNKIEEFVRKKRVVKDPQNVEIKEVKLPWYKRPIERKAFSYRKGKDNKLYVRHNEWSKHTWIGPYNTKNDVDRIIDSYVSESLKAPLDRKVNYKIHSVIVEDETKFFREESKSII